MTPHSEIQLLGYEAHRNGIPKENNPFLYHSKKSGGHAKAAAWATGWERSRKEKEGINELNEQKKRAYGH